MVFATQNPVDYEGTFSLPESQLDRFLMCLHMGYPQTQDELEILRSVHTAYDDIEVKPVATGSALFPPGTVLPDSRMKIHLAYSLSPVCWRSVSNPPSWGSGQEAEIAPVFVAVNNPLLTA